MEEKSKLPSLEDATLSSGQRVLLRLDLNVPIQDGKVFDEYRIKRIFPTLEFLSRKGCRTVIVSHIGSDGKESLRPVERYLAGKFNVSFAENLTQAEEMVGKVSQGSFVILENIRREKGEKENDEGLSHRLGALGEVYINDAFAVSHRKHASVVGVTKFLPSYAGFLLQEEIQALSLALRPPQKSLFILGGAKFETKLPLLIKFLDRYARVFVGGALANDIFRAMELEVGTSLVSPIAPDLSVIVNHPNLRIPLDVIVKRLETTHSVSAEAVTMSDRIVDVGEKTLELLKEFVNESDFVLWNGPLGVYQEGFGAGTERLADIIAKHKAHSIVGGGDTIAAIEKLSLGKDFGFISTGGGAMLDFLANETLPGIEALKKEKK